MWVLGVRGIGAPSYPPMELPNIICPKIAWGVLVHKIWYIYVYESKKNQTYSCALENVKSENIFYYKQNTKNFFLDKTVTSF